VIVDAHVHLLPDGLSAAVREFFTEHIAKDLSYPASWRDARAALAAAGVDRCWTLPYVAKPDRAAALNEWTARTFADDEMVVPGATVHPGDDVAVVVRDALGPLGCRVFKLHCSVGGFAVDDQRLEPLWRTVSERGTPVVVHAGTAVDGTTGAAELEPIRAVAAQWPDARIVVAHLGAPAVCDTMDLVRSTRSVHADFTPVVHDLVPIERDVAAELADRLLLGTDVPNVVPTVECGISYIRSLQLPRSAEDAILGGNALRLVDAT
jgi:predicted TIM-barrel fold metal-dependent hydrolase